MIASVVVTMNEPAGRMQATLDTIAARSQIELGEFADASCKLPLLIEGGDRSGVEETTRWLQELPAVRFVDVVFVYLEASDASPAGSP